MPQPVLSLENLLFRWPDQVAACLDIERFEVAADEQVFIHGESGSGKSTLLNLIAGVLMPLQGNIVALGEGVTQDSALAHMWMSIASVAGTAEATKLRDIIASRMTPQQIEKAQEMARKCQERNFKGC